MRCCYWDYANRLVVIVIVIVIVVELSSLCRYFDPNKHTPELAVERGHIHLEHTWTGKKHERVRLL